MFNSSSLYDSIIIKEDQFHKQYKLSHFIAKGSFAVVRKGIKKEDNSLWAVKIVRRGQLSPDDEHSLLSEVSIMEHLNHPNIILLKEFFDCPRNMYIVMELLTGGQLFDRIVSKGHYSELESKVAFRQIISALSYLHSQGIVHRDLKPENIIYCNPSENSPLKLTDFGFAQKLLKPDDLLHIVCGTPLYVAPDMLRRDSSGYGKEVDMWSAGVLLFVMLGGYPPFYDEDNAKLLMAVQEGEYDYPSPYWDGITLTCKDLIDKLLVIDPASRFTAQQALDHSWLSETNQLLPLQSQSSTASAGTPTISRSILSSLRSRFLPSSRSESLSTVRG